MPWSEDPSRADSPAHLFRSETNVSLERIEREQIARVVAHASSLEAAAPNARDRRDDTSTKTKALTGLPVTRTLSLRTRLLFGRSLVRDDRGVGVFRCPHVWTRELSIGEALRDDRRESRSSRRSKPRSEDEDDAVLLSISGDTERAKVELSRAPEVCLQMQLLGLPSSRMTTRERALLAGLGRDSEIYRGAADYSHGAW